MSQFGSCSAQRANEAALSYEFKDDELKRNALQNENLIRSMNGKAGIDKNELERRLQQSYSQCQDVITRATECQNQAHDKIELILEENHRDKDKMQSEMQWFTKNGGADVQKLAFYETQYAQLQAAFTQLQEAETEGRQENVVLQNGLEWTQAQFKYGEEEVSALWRNNKVGHEVLSSVRTEYENQCNGYAQEVRVVSDVNSSQTVKMVEG